MTLWAAIVGASVTCYLLKRAGLSVPERILNDRRAARIADLLPVALLATLIATQTVSTGRHLAVDARAVGLATAAAAQLLRAPFLLVVASAAATTAAVRLLH
ncbi:MAG: AzlD domain-containing protein [Actinomycetota bacterium]|nr:AzlD domain-containing protein [Actinomycetota bacterium]